MWQRVARREHFAFSNGKREQWAFTPRKATVAMHANMMWKHELAESIKILEWALERNFAGETLELNGWSMPVDDVLEILRSYVYQIARTEAVHEQWLREATAERD